MQYLVFLFPKNEKTWGKESVSKVDTCRYTLLMIG